MNIQKVIIISAVVSANVAIWYEVFGIGFMVALGLGVLILVLFTKEK
jgi:hypothetical protein